MTKCDFVLPVLSLLISVVTLITPIVCFFDNRKSPTKVVKKLRLQLKGDSEKLERPLKQSDFENSSSDDESSSEDEKWRIFEESSEDEIDRTLEDKADSLNLSALNVKSIIHVSGKSL